MRTLRSLVLRGLAALQLVLLPAVQLADGTGVHRCPEHDAGLGVAVAAGVAHHPSHQHKASHHVCTCLGACSGTSLAFAPTAPAVLPLPTPSPYRTTHELRTAAPRAPVRLLPFALGPPTHA